GRGRRRSLEQAPVPAIGRDERLDTPAQLGVSPAGPVDIGRPLSGRALQGLAQDLLDRAPLGGRQPHDRMCFGARSLHHSGRRPLQAGDPVWPDPARLLLAKKSRWRDTRRKHPMMPTNHGTLNMTKTADGRIVSTRTYSSFPYKVTVEHDGAIRVKHGDWLSKYSAAMYGNFKGINEFARKGRDGKLRRIPNPNLIYAGETIYHIPTYKYSHPMRMDQVEMVASPWSDDEIEANIVKALSQEHQFGGEQLHVLTEAVHILHKTADYADGA